MEWGERGTFSANVGLCNPKQMVTAWKNVFFGGWRTSLILELHIGLKDIGLNH